MLFGLNAISLANPIDEIVLPENIRFTEQVKPLLDRRCAVCHGCYNAPCQLKLTSYEGLQRGLIQDHIVYDTKRRKSIEPTRLGFDAFGSGWHKAHAFGEDKQFTPIYDEKTDSPVDRLENSFIVKLVDNRRENPGPLNDQGADLYDSFQAEKSRVCPTTPQDLNRHLIDRLAEGQPSGMPYGLPALDDEQVRTLKIWVAQGSQGPESIKPVQSSATAGGPSDKEVLSALEQYFNGPSDIKKSKRRLVNRYIYEHLFLAHLYFSEDEADYRTNLPLAQRRDFYEMIRKVGSCDADAEVIATRKPWQLPEGVKEKNVKYCFRRIDSTIVHKTHITYLMNPKRLDRYNELFYSQPWEVKDPKHKWKKGMYPATQFGVRAFKAMGYNSRKDNYASNPFLTFQSIPAKARYQFLLDDATFFVRTFIRGPVCKGNTAVDSIDEQFFTLFIDPDSDLLVNSPDYEDDIIEELALPAAFGSDSGVISGLVRVKFLLRKRKAVHEKTWKHFETYFAQNGNQAFGVEDVWNGDSGTFRPKNPDAAQTIFRHYDSATVVNGHVGPLAKTMYVMGYLDLERFYYSLVAGYDVFSDLAHQLFTRSYMNSLRQDSEEGTLLFMPPNIREDIRKFWYSTSPEEGKIGVGRIESLLLYGERNGSSYDRLSDAFPVPAFADRKRSAYGNLSIEERQSLLTQLTSNENDLGVSGDLPAPSKRAEIGLHIADFLKGVYQNRLQHVDSDVFPTTQTLNPGYRSESVLELHIGSIESLADFEKELSKVTGRYAVNNPWVTFMPNITHLLIGGQLYSLVRNKEHYNVLLISTEGDRRWKQRDSLIAYKGILGSYPNMIFNIPLDRAQEFLKNLVSVHTSESYEILLSQFGNLRTSEKFWDNFDALSDAFIAAEPINAGLLDLNRYDVRRDKADGFKSQDIEVFNE
tara:strand:- start:78171 stop:80942 length:2772 start_codon:yes stop_codon:yes gene_type:complete